MLGYGYHSDEPVKGKATMHKPTNVDGNKVAVVDGENRQTAAVLLLEEGKYFCTYFHQFRPRFRPGEDEPPTLHYGKGRLFKYCRPELADFTLPSSSARKIAQGAGSGRGSLSRQALA